MAIAFTLLDGTIPPGLTLNSATGNLSGTATTPGVYVFTIGAVNGDRSGQTTLRITVVVCDDESSSVVSSSSSSSVASSSSSSSVASSSSSGTTEAFRPAIAEIHHTGPSHVSFVFDKENAIDTDEDTYATHVQQNASPITNGWEQLWLRDFPDPDPMQTLVSVKVLLRTSYVAGPDSYFVTAGLYIPTSVSDITEPDDIIEDFSSEDRPPAWHEVIITPERFAEYTDGVQVGIWQWATGSTGFSPYPEYRIHDCWIEYTYA